jgi:hypothetical protein
MPCSQGDGKTGGEGDADERKWRIYRANERVNQQRQAQSCSSAQKSGCLRRKKKKGQKGEDETEL